MDTKHVDGAEEMVPKLVQKARSADEKLVTFVRERPVVALAAALVTGYLIGRIISRLG